MDDFDPGEARELSEFARLARRLKEAHRRVADLASPAEEQAELTKRLLVITAAAKHDLGDASRRLDAFLNEFPD